MLRAEQLEGCDARQILLEEMEVPKLLNFEDEPGCPSVEEILLLGSGERVEIRPMMGHLDEEHEIIADKPRLVLGPERDVDRSDRGHRPCRLCRRELEQELAGRHQGRAIAISSRPPAVRAAGGPPRHPVR